MQLQALNWLNIAQMNLFSRHKITVAVVVDVDSRGQTTIFAQGRYRFQYNRPARRTFLSGALILKAITPLRENSGLATRDYSRCRVDGCQV